MDHILGSKTLIMELTKLVLSISYDEIKQFKQSLAIQSQPEDEENVSSVFARVWTKYCNTHIFWQGNVKETKRVFLS